MKRIKDIFLLIVFALMGTGCSFLDVDPKVIVADTFYTSEERAYSGLIGVYGGLGRQPTYGRYYIVSTSNIDDLAYYRSANGTLSEIYYLGHSAGNGSVYQMWCGFYSVIECANLFMEAMEEQDFIYDPNHEYYNEARFLRAYCHFILAQGWGDVPLRAVGVSSAYEASLAATPQHDVLKWVVSEMEDCLELASTSWTSPSRVNKTIMWGILARVYLFMGGETVEGNEEYRKEYIYKGMCYAKEVIDSGIHKLNPDYTQVFINMISDQYDTTYKESMWEVEFMGDRSSSDNWSNGYVGSYLGMRSNIGENYDKANCNYAQGYINGSLQLWNLYWITDRTSDEYQTDDLVTDVRQNWNMCPYNYVGTSSYQPYGQNSGSARCTAGIDKAPYVYARRTTSASDTAARSIRNCSKFRRECIYEGVSGFKSTGTGINFPILRYADVILMYAEAYNEYYGAPTEEVFEYVKMIRDRAGIKTRDYSEYSDYEHFQSLVRNERGRELVFEAIRKYDLIRWGIFEEKMREYLTLSESDQCISSSCYHSMQRLGENIQPRHIYYPIPTKELGVNTLLQQNPLWR